MLRVALRPPPFPYEDTRTWIALQKALRDLERLGAVQLAAGERAILSVLCAALDRERVFSLGESTRY